nr:hypothetical protein [Tanacetum cinerariifolium]
THGKKKDTLIVISSIRLTKLVIYHLQRKHKFQPRPDSPLHLTNEEPVLGYLKFSSKGTKREVFEMPIPGSDPDTPASKLTKTKPKPTAPKADPRPSVLKLVSTKQPKPKSAPAKTQGKKRKLTTKISDKPSKAMKSRPSLVSKKLKPLSSLRSVDESVAEDVPSKEHQVSRSLLNLQMSKKKSPADRYISQRRTSTPTGSSGHNESSSLYAELRLTDSEEESEEDVLGADAGGQGEGQAGPDPGAQDEGQAGSNPDEQAESQAGPDPGNAEESQPMPSPVVHAGLDRDDINLDVADVSTQPPPEQMDEGFTATAYPKVQNNLKLTVEEQVMLEEPPSSLGTLSSLQHLTKVLSFGDLFFSDKPSEADNDKATAKTEAESMVSVMIQQDMSSIPLMITLLIDLTSRPKSPKEQRLDSHRARLYTLEQLDIPHQVSKAVDKVVTVAVDWAMQAPLQNYFRDLPEADMKEILHQRMWKTDSYKSHKAHMQLYKAVKKSMNRDHSEELVKDLAEARKTKKKSRESPKMPPGSPPHQPPLLPPPAGPFGASRSHGASGSSQVPPPPPPPPSTNQEGQSKGSAVPSSSKIAASAEYQAWTTTDIRLGLCISLTPADLQMDEDMAPDEQTQSSDDEDIRNAHIYKASALASNYSPPPKDSLLGQIECHKLLTDSVDDSILRHNVSKPLPMGGPPGQVTIQYDFFFNKDLEYLRYGSKGSRPALSISKIKAAYYPDVGLEQMVPDQIHTSEGDHRALRTHMRILSVVRIKVFSMYGYEYMKKIVLRRLNHLPPKDKKILTTAINLWTRHLVIRQRVEDFQIGIQSYQTQLNLTKPKWDATCFKYKHDYTVIDSSRAATFWDRYGVQMIMRFNEIHKFSDGTLQQINEALDYRVKEFKINRINPGLNMRFWTRKDVDRSKAFMFSIEKRLKKRRIFCNMESFVGGRVRDGDYKLLKRIE